MGVAPVLAGFFAFLNVLTIWAGGGLAVQLPLLILTIFTSIYGLAKPGEESPANGRTLSIFAIVFALLPFIKPQIEHWAYLRRERIRAQETAPRYEDLAQKIEQYEADLFAFREKWGQYPPLDGSTRYPMFDAQGARLNVPENAAPQPPFDSFTLSSPMTVVPIGGTGALIISVGQDDQRDWPQLRDIIAIDGEPKDPLAPLAWTGVDLRTRTYDPTNGALSPGDVITWVSHTPLDKDDALKRLDDAWNRVHALTPLPKTKPQKGVEPIPDAEDDARTAEKLLEDEEWLGAIAAASRAAANRRPHPNFWAGVPALARADFNRGYALFQLGHFRTAADFMLQYLQTAPNDVEALYWAGVCLYLGRNYEGAKRHFAAAFQIDPNHALAPKAMAAYTAMNAQRPPDLPRPWILDNPAAARPELQLLQNQQSGQPADFSEQSVE